MSYVLRSLRTSALRSSSSWRKRQTPPTHMSPSEETNQSHANYLQSPGLQSKSHHAFISRDRMAEPSATSNPRRSHRTSLPALAATGSFWSSFTFTLHHKAKLYPLEICSVSQQIGKNTRSWQRGLAEGTVHGQQW